MTDIYSNQSVSLPCSCQLFFCFGTAAWTRSQISESWDNTVELWGLLKGRAGRLRSTGVDCFLRHTACLSGRQRVPSWFSSVQSVITLCWVATLQYTHFLALPIFFLVFTASHYIFIAWRNKWRPCVTDSTLASVFCQSYTGNSGKFMVTFGWLYTTKVFNECLRDRYNSILYVKEKQKFSEII